MKSYRRKQGNKKTKQSRNLYKKRGGMNADENAGIDELVQSISNNITSEQIEEYTREIIEYTHEIEEYTKRLNKLLNKAKNNV